MNQILRTSTFSLLLLITIIIFGCSNKQSPKPKGYYRITFPEKSFVLYENNYPYSFMYPTYAQIIESPAKRNEAYWINIHFPKNNADIHLSYKNIDDNLLQLTEDSRELAFKHSIRATAINEKVYINRDQNVYGTIYEINGNTASPIQFHLTDSTKNFIRGSLYIKEIPNYDSLQPVINFLEKDVYQFIETFNWK